MIWAVVYIGGGLVVAVTIYVNCLEAREREGQLPVCRRRKKR